jgi:CheY-like chemotaxis protein
MEKTISKRYLHGNEPSAERTSEAQAQGTPTAETEGARCILLAEDNPTHQEVALLLLTKVGCRVEVVSNGTEAVRALQQGDYALVLMDCQMPVMDGYEATRRIRDPHSGVRNPQIPIVAYTSSGTAEDFDRCLQAGMNDCVPKPADARALAGALSRWGIYPSAALRD